MIEQFITRVFFAARDRRLHRLRDLQQAVDDVSDADAIAPFVVEYLRTRAEIEARVFLEGADGSFGAAAGAPAGTARIQRDHVAVVALRSARAPMRAPEWNDLGIAFPLLVRGRLRGIMFCREMDGGEIAPDETHALEAVAARMANDREILLGAELRGELDELRVQMFELRARAGM